MKRKITNCTFALLLLVVGLCQASCISRTRKIPANQRLLPAQSLTRGELLHKLEERSTAIRTLTASATFDASGGGIDTGQITEWKQTTGSIIVERPSQIRVIVRVPVLGTALADMVSDGSRFKLSMEGKWITGDSNLAGNDPNPVKNLRPKHVLDALFVDVLAYKNNPKVVSTLKETVEGQRSYYIVEFVNADPADDAQILEEIWFDRTDLEVSRKIVYGKDGKVQSRIEFLDYKMGEGIAFPEIIHLQRTIEHYALKMTFQKHTFNEPLPETAFLLERPNGAKEIEIAPAALSSP